MPGGSTGIAAASDRIRVYRNAALATGSSGTWTSLAFDTTSTQVIVVSLALSGGKIPIVTAGDYYISGYARWTGALLLTAFESRIIREISGGGEALVVGNRDGGVSALAVDQIDFAGMVTLGVGDAIRIDVRSIGVGSVDLTTGDEYTFVHVQKV